jgi:hypothetical protein
VTVGFCTWISGLFPAEDKDVCNVCLAVDREDTVKACCAPPAAGDVDDGFKIRYSDAAFFSIDIVPVDDDVLIPDS